MANKPKRKSKKQNKRVTYRKLITGTAVCVLLVATSYLYYLNHLINLRFDDDTWEIPSRVYARPLEVYPGLSLNAESLQYELDLSTYQRVNLTPTSGQYRILDSSIELHTRPFVFSDQTEPAHKVRITFAGNQVIRIVDLATARKLDLLRLPPVIIGSYIPQNGEDRVLLSMGEIPKTFIDIYWQSKTRSFISILVSI